MREFKIVVFGAPSVGKSALTTQMVKGTYSDEYDPTIEDSFRVLCDFGGKRCIMEVLDSAGTEQFVTMRDLYMRNGQGFVLVYAIDDRDTFIEATKLYQQLVRVRETYRVPLIVVGNKCDLSSERQVLRSEGQALANEFNCSFAETSAKMRINVYEIFHDIIEQIRYIEGTVTPIPVGEHPKQWYPASKNTPYCCFM